MFGDRNPEPLGFAYSFRDLLIALMVVFMAIAALAIIHSDQTSKINIPYQGDIVITMTWPIAFDADMDLWVQSPNDAPVGYSRLSGKDCNLVRDDLGREVDPLSRNQEMTICQKPLSGQWAVDVMLYNSYDQQLPIPVTVKVYEIKDGKSKVLLSEIVPIEKNGEVRTMWQFTFDDHGDIVPGSVNNIPVDLYALSGHGQDDLYNPSGSNGQNP